MIFLSIFIIEFILLFFLSKKLIKSLSLLIYKVTKSQKAVVNILAIIFLPGTIFHELAHLLTAGIMLVPVGEISVIPEVDEQNVKLGSVQIGKVDPLRLTIIGVAPVILGFLSILGILYFAGNFQNLNWWQIALGLYLIFEISNTMFSSKKDIQGTIGFVVAIFTVLIIGIIILYFWNLPLLQNIWNFLISQNFEKLSNFFKLGSFYLLIPLLLDFLLILLARPFIKN